MKPNLKQGTKRGVVLVITVIMLSMVTLMAVVFLSVSRREQSSVAVTGEMQTARWMADAAVARAEADAVARMIATTNAFAYDLAVSTNRPNAIAPPIFASLNQQLTFLTNLQVGAQPPVYIRVNNLGNDYRHYLDFNRDGKFDGAASGGLSFGGVGDPEWIGVLEHPDRPHADDNRFIGRFAYLVLPAGKTLDINFIHNNALNPNLVNPTVGYIRGDGTTPDELNLAAFLRELDQNTWLPNGVGYTYNPPSQIGGTSFDDALSVLYKRFSNPPNFHAYYDAQEFFTTNALHLQIPSAIGLARGLNNNPDPYLYYRLLAQLGSDSSPSLSNMLFQADFQLHPAKKFHLNVQQGPLDGVTNYATWNLLPTAASPTNAENPRNFFLQAGDLLLRSALTTNILADGLGRPIFTNFMLGLQPVRQSFGVTNIQIFPANEYTAATHRYLQVAANLYDATTRRVLQAPISGTNYDYPSVFRPIFMRTPTNVVLAGYEEEADSSRVDIGLNFMTAEQLFQAPVTPQIPLNTPLFGVHLFGVPWVIGDKKGFPNFNEANIDAYVQVSRKLEVIRQAGGGFQTNQMHTFSISEGFGVEAWNSYTNNFRHPVEVRATNYFTYELRAVVKGISYPLQFTNGTSGQSMIVSAWTNRLANGSFLTPVLTNIALLTNSSYLASSPPYLFDPKVTNVFETTFDPPRLYLFITNRVQYVAIDRGVVPNRIIDFVSLSPLTSQIDIGGRLSGDAFGSGSQLFSAGAAVTESQLWNTNRARPTGPTIGIQNQISVAQGNPGVSDAIWRSALPDPSEADKTKAIQKFASFFQQGNTEPSIQVPFTPTRTFYVRSSWQANDPLVHYTLEDLTDPVLTANTNTPTQFIHPPNAAIPASNIGLMNQRFAPWGGNPQKSSDAMSYLMGIKDPGIKNSDDWNFPTTNFPSVGWIGKVHRGTPWQTIYLKADVVDPALWAQWSGNINTHPTNDWKLADLFTVAPSVDATRGLLSVNQTNAAAWAAVLGGIDVLSNSVSNPGPVTGVRFDDLFVTPATTSFEAVVAGINAARAARPRQSFDHLGEILSAPALTTASPFLNMTEAQKERGLTDEAVERIPQKVLSLLKADEPRLVIYAFGQALKPADNSLVSAGGFFNICTNYQITGEFVSKTVVRIDGAPVGPRAVVESYTVLPP